MAVARMELGVEECDWLVGMLEAAQRAGIDVPVGTRGPRNKLTPKEQKRVMREVKRAQQAAHDSYDREQAETRRRRAAMRTAPGKDTEALDYGQRRHRGTVVPPGDIPMPREREYCPECKRCILPNGGGHDAGCPLVPAS
jgi:hypothetical protein